MCITGFCTLDKLLSDEKLSEQQLELATAQAVAFIRQQQIELFDLVDLLRYYAKKEIQAQYVKKLYKLVNLTSVILAMCPASGNRDILFKMAGTNNVKLGSASLMLEKLLFHCPQAPTEAQTEAAFDVGYALTHIKETDLSVINPADYRAAHIVGIITFDPAVAIKFFQAGLLVGAYINSHQILENGQAYKKIQLHLFSPN